MAVSILEALMNAEHNLRTGIVHVRSGALRTVVPLALSQLHNAVVLLEKGYGPDELVEPLLEEYGEVDAVPDKQ